VGAILLYDVSASEGLHPCEILLACREIPGEEKVTGLCHVFLSCFTKVANIIYTSNGTHEKLGFKAQQLQEVNEDFTYAVKQGEGAELDEILQVNTFRMQPYIIKAIQEIKERLEVIENERNKYAN